MANSPTPNAEAASNNPKYSVGAGSTLDTAAGRITASSSGGVEYIRPELSNMFYQYQLVEDCVKGEEAVKQRGTTYLPHPDPKDTNATRYDNYKLRAVFYNATRRTLDGLVGQVFLRDPVVTLPTACKVIEKDADGSGVSLSQLAKKAEEYVLQFGRCGLLVDYPDTQGRSTSRAELLSGTVRPTVGIYDPRDVRNWRTIVVKGRVLYSLIVLAEVYDKEDDGFEAKKEVQYRVLRLEANGSKYKYTVEVQRPKDAKYVATKYEPRDGKGNNLEEIPFSFIGAKTNNADVDKPPMFDLAAVNIAHYRNSADYEESVFLIGQPTPWASGLTESWVKDVLHGEIRIGSRAIIPLPENGACGLLQAEANTLASEAMEKKERQMVALGAKLVEQKQVQRTATESNHDKAAETSVLSATAKNVEQAFKWGLEWCAIFTGEVGVNDDARQKIVDFKLNSEFDLTQLDATMLGAVVKAWQSGALMDEEMRDKMHEAGLADKKFEEWQTEQTDKMTTAVDQLAAETIAQQVPVNSNV